MESNLSDLETVTRNQFGLPSWLKKDEEGYICIISNDTPESDYYLKLANNEGHTSQLGMVIRLSLVFTAAY